MIAKYTHFMKFNSKLLYVCGIICILIALGVFLFYLLIPAGASDEYIYTVEQVYGYSFFPFAILGCWLIWRARREKIIAIWQRIDAIHRYITSQVVLRCFLAILLATSIIVIWRTSLSFFGWLVLSLLPYLCLMGMVWFFRLRQADKPFFLSVIHGSFLWSLLVWAQTNLLSAFNLIDGKIISIFWVLVAIPVAFLLLRLRKDWKLASFQGWELIPVIVACVTLLIGLVYPPNHFDVLIYHMPRVAHWLQNGSLAPYVTPVDRQTGMAPFNAYVALQSYAPNHMDYFVNLGQWLAYTGCMAGVCQIAITLGASRLAQNAALVFAATLPNAIIQASNTESCLIVAFFLCAMAWLALLWVREEQKQTQTGILFGIALGLAILSKGSAYPIALPFVALIAWHCLKNFKAAFIGGLLAACIVVALNAPHIYRNYLGTGSIVGSTEGNIMKRPTPQTFLVNSIYHFVANNPVLLAHGGKAALRNFADSIGVDGDDKSLFPWGDIKNMRTEYKFTESEAPNPAHSVFLIFLALAIIFWKFRPPALYSFLIAFSFIIFVLILTWHPWVGRIQLALFLLVAPICGMYMAWLKNVSLRNFFLAAFCVIAVFPLFSMYERPLFSRTIFYTQLGFPSHFLTASRNELLFNAWVGISPTLYKDFSAAAEFMASRNPDVIGISTGADGIEYPIWRIMREKLGDKSPKIVDVVQADEHTPRFVLEYVRDWLTIPEYRPRVVEYEDGERKIVFRTGKEVKQK